MADCGGHSAAAAAVRRRTFLVAGGLGFCGLNVGGLVSDASANGTSLSDSRFSCREVSRVDAQRLGNC